MDKINEHGGDTCIDGILLKYLHHLVMEGTKKLQRCKRR